MQALPAPPARDPTQAMFIDPIFWFKALDLKNPKNDAGWDTGHGRDYSKPSATSTFERNPREGQHGGVRLEGRSRFMLDLMDAVLFSISMISMGVFCWT